MEGFLKNWNLVMKPHLGVSAEKKNKTVYVGVETLRTFGANGIVVHDEYFHHAIDFLHDLAEVQWRDRLKHCRRISIVATYNIHDLQKGWLREHEIWSER